MWEDLASVLVPTSSTALSEHLLSGKGCMQPSRKLTVISLETRLAFQEPASVKDPEVGSEWDLQHCAERMMEGWSGGRMSLHSYGYSGQEGLIAEVGLRAGMGTEARHRCFRPEGRCCLCPTMGCVSYMSILPASLDSCRPSLQSSGSTDISLS